MRLAYASPLPPLASGISDYSAELLPYLARHFEAIDLFVDGGCEPVPELADAFEIRPLRDLGPRLAAGGYGAALYQLGNDARYHGAIYRTLLTHPGVVVLHEYMFHHLVRELTLVRGDLAAYLEEHRYSAGASGYALARRSVETGLPLDIWSYPLFERVVDRSLGVLVHNEATRHRVLASRPLARVAKVPHHLDLAALPRSSRAAVRRGLGLAEDALVVASFGFVTPAKRLEVALRAFARLRRRFPHAVYLVAGGVSPYYDLEAVLGRGLGEGVVLTGRLELDELLAAMSAVDVAVNLRHPTGGETSGTLIRLLGLGKAVIVSDVGSFREVPDGCCARVPLGRDEEETLFAYLVALAEDPELRRGMGEAARRHMATEHTLEGSARLYAAFVEEVATSPPPRPAVPPLAPYPAADVLSDLVAAMTAAAVDLGVSEADDDLLSGLSEVVVDLDLDRPPTGRRR